MAEIAGSSSTVLKDDKPVVVRVKRKHYQSPLEAFWLEINERPLKRPLLDFEKLSISDSSAKVEELKTKKLFVQHVDTVNSADATVDILQSVVVSKQPSSTSAAVSKAKSEERRRSFKPDHKHELLLDKAKEKQEILSRNARFEQIWRSRKGKKDATHSDALRDMCHLYDVVRVDVAEAASEVPGQEDTGVQEQEDTDLEDHRIMSSFLPLLREFIPSAAEEIESEINDYVWKQASKDDYVYDLYTVKGDDISMMEEDASNHFPLVQVDDDDSFYDGPEASEYESDDSNAEDNPLNDYPDEETDEEEDGESKTSDDNSEEENESASDKSIESEDLGYHYRSREAEPLYEDDIYDDYDGAEMQDDDDDGDDDDHNDVIWSYR